MAKLAGTRTEKNLLTAFAGESQARNRYTYCTKQARNDGFVRISDIFTETANHEKEHAKRLFKFLEDDEIEIAGAFPAGVIGTTLENLKASAAGENFEHAIMYPGFAKTAEERGPFEYSRCLHGSGGCRETARETLQRTCCKHYDGPGF